MNGLIVRGSPHETHLHPLRLPSRQPYQSADQKTGRQPNDTRSRKVVYIISGYVPG